MLVFFVVLEFQVVTGFGACLLANSKVVIPGFSYARGSVSLLFGISMNQVLTHWVCLGVDSPIGR